MSKSYIVLVVGILISLGFESQGLSQTRSVEEYALTNVLAKLQGLDERDRILALMDSAAREVAQYSDRAEWYLDYLSRSIDSLQFPELYASNLYMYGVYQQQHGEWVRALNLYFRALPTFESLQDVASTANSLNAIGNIFEELGMNSTALSYYQAGLARIDSVDQLLVYGILLNNLGEILYQEGAYEEALRYYQRSFARSENEAEEYKVVPLHNLGRTHGVLGQYELALQQLRTAYAIDKRLGDVEGMAYDQLEIGKVYLYQSQFDSAQYHLRLAYLQGQRVNSWDVLQEALEQLTKLFKEQQDYQLAYRYQSLYRTYTDSLFAQQHLDEAQALKSAYDQRLQVEELLRLQNERELEDLRLKEANLQALSFIVTFFLVLVVLGVLLWQYRTNAKASEMLNASNEKLEDSNVALEEINQKLGHSELGLQEVNATKDKFFSIISHDLKSPLNSLMGLLNLLLKYGDALSIEERTELTQKIDDSVKALTNLLDNLLKWSMAQTDTIDYLPKVLDLKAEVDRTVQLLHFNAEQKSIHIEVKVPVGTMLFADQDMINFILRNLITNAIKFTYTEGRISLVAKEVDQDVLLEVVDNGMGISEENLGKLFRIDTDVSTKGTDNETGTGLGLLLIKEFVEKNQGSISVNSVEGKGTTFSLRFPSLSHLSN